MHKLSRMYTLEIIIMMVAVSKNWVGNEEGTRLRLTRDLYFHERAVALWGVLAHW